MTELHFTVRGVIRVPVVTSAGVTDWKLPRTRWRSITVDGCRGCCVCCCDCTRIPSNEYDKEPCEEVAERRAGVKRSETNERRKSANPSQRAEENCQT